METTYWIIGDNVRRLRMENGITQEELAEKALLSPKGIQKVTAGIYESLLYYYWGNKRVKLCIVDN